MEDRMFSLMDIENTILEAMFSIYKLKDRAEYSENIEDCLNILIEINSKREEGDEDEIEEIYEDAKDIIRFISEKEFNQGKIL